MKSSHIKLNLEFGIISIEFPFFREILKSSKMEIFSYRESFLLIDFYYNQFPSEIILEYISEESFKKFKSDIEKLFYEYHLDYRIELEEFEI